MQHKRSPAQQAAPILHTALDWDDVRLFLALCRSRSLRVAAERLAVDPSTVSRRLAALEEVLAATLFERDREGIAPTKAAEDLLPVAEELEATMTRFTTAAEGLERAASGLVRITCPPDVAEVVVVPLLADLLGRYPALRVELDPAETVLDLTRREADIALRTVRPKRGDLLVQKLASVRWWPAAAPAIARKVGTLRSLDAVPWIGTSDRLSGTGPGRWLAAQLKGCDPLVRSDSLRLALSLASAGLGATLVPETSIAHYGLAALKLGPALREASASLPTDELYLVTHRALRQVPRVQVTWELIASRVSERYRHR